MYEVQTVQPKLDNVRNCHCIIMYMLLGNVHKKINRRWFLVKKGMQLLWPRSKGNNRGFRCLLLTNDVSHISNTHLKLSSLSFLY